MAKRELRLRVEGWQHSRHVMIQDKVLYMEVARTACHHCPTCSYRIETITSRLQGCKTPWRYVHLDGGMYLAVEPEQVPAKVGTYLSELLGLRVSES